MGECMANEACDNLATESEHETNLVKKGISYTKAGQCYKNNNQMEQFKLMLEKAGEAFHQEAARMEDPYEKALITSYEALCWIRLEKFEEAQALVAKSIELSAKEPKCPLPPILEFVKYLATKEVLKAEQYWKDMYENFADGIIELLKEAFISINPSAEPPTIRKSLKLSVTWEVIMKGKEEADWTVTFYDVQETFEEKIILRKEFLEDLSNNMKSLKHYRFLQIIKSIISSKGDDLTNKLIFIILATSADKKLKFGVMFGQLQEGDLHVFALWPESLIQAISLDRNIFSAFISRLIQNPEWFSDVNLVTRLSSKKEKEGEEKERETAENGNTDYFI